MIKKEASFININMDNFNVKCLVHSDVNACFWNKCYKEKGSSLLCHKCILDK